MGIVTDAHSRDATLRLEKTGLLPFFCCMVSYDMVKVKKPACDPFLMALEMMKTSPSDTVLIGDSPRRDIEPGRHLGIRTCMPGTGTVSHTTAQMYLLILLSILWQNFLKFS